MTGTTHNRRPAWRPLAGAAAGAALLVTAGVGVWASLNATAFNETPQSISSGTLSLTLGDNGTGFSSTIDDMAPGDIVNRYVDLTNGGTLAAQGLTLKVVPASGGDTELITDGTDPATKALQISVTSCATSWTPATGDCSDSGATTSLLSATTLSGLASAKPLTAAGSLAANAVEHLKVSVTLPEQTETTVNGEAPATTIQGHSVDLTYTFEEAQRDATTTNS